MQALKHKVAIIGTVGLPANYGGFETLASHLVKNLGGQYDFSVYCSGKKYAKNTRKSRYMGARLVYLPMNANGIQSILYDTLSILHALFYADVLLILGVAGAWILPFVKLFTRKKIIVSIDGIEWKREKWSPIAKMYLWLAERIAVNYSHLDISDNESIQDYTALRYGSLSRIVEYGGDHVYAVEASVEDHERFSFLRYLYAVKVCRIEPENNVHLVLEAFRAVSNRQLVIVGNWDNSEYGRQLKKEYSAFTHIHLLDPIYEERTINLLRSNAYLYIHGHSAGGTNPSLVEAMNLGLPVISYDVSYNRTTTEQKAIYFRSAADIAIRLQTSPMDTLRDLGRSMEQIARRRYTWQIISSRYQAMFEEVLSNVPQKKLDGTLAQTLPQKRLTLHQAAHLKHAYLFFEKR